MRYRFTKMQGCGNDYVYMDCFTQAVRDPSELARQMSDRHFGVGSDGLILVCPPTDSGADFRMRMFNADGSEGRMCGNGVRCAAVFARRCGIITGNEAVVQTLAGSKRLALGQMHGNRCTVRVQMGQPSFFARGPACFVRRRKRDSLPDSGGKGFSFCNTRFRGKSALRDFFG